MCFRILGIGIMTVICSDELDPGLLRHPKQRLIHQLLLGDPVILQLQEEVPLPEDLLIGQSRFLRLLVESAGEISGDFSCQAGGSADDPLMVSAEDLLVHARPVIIAVHISGRDDLYKIGIPCIVLCQQDQMVVTILAGRIFPVKAGARRHVHLTADHRADPLAHAFLIEINDTKHNAVICDRGAVHSQLLHPADIVPDLVGAVQKAVFCMCVKMSESQGFSFSRTLPDHPHDHLDRHENDRDQYPDQQLH